MEKRIIEGIIALSALSWGVWLLLPFDTFGSSATFRVLPMIAPEWAWGAVFVTVSLLLLFGILRCSRAIRRHALLFLSLLWLATWSALVISNWRSTAATNYIWWAILSAYSYMRVASNGVSNHQH
jgi:hypothetical protein